jgi:hypothetical protein
MLITSIKQLFFFLVLTKIHISTIYFLSCKIIVFKYVHDVGFTLVF